MEKNVTAYSATIHALRDARSGIQELLAPEQLAEWLYPEW